jgi:tRNA pseudouridine55 synthase
MNPGIHLVHKPIGPTSFSLVQSYIHAARAHKERRPPRICHGGTLDPFASGLLLILVEPATRLFQYLHAIPKVYDATVCWGVETDNGDPHGRVVFTGDSSGLSPEQLEDALAKFVGWHDQIPHATSAKRIDGERAYLKAHRGETVVMPASRVYLHEARWLGHDLPRQSRLRMTVRGGYYVRALARDLGRLVGCGAHLTELHRTAIGPWTDPGPDQSVEIHGRDLLPWAATRLLTDQDVGDLRQSREIPVGDLVPPDWPMPSGFPDPQAPVRGFHLERFCFLLSPVGGNLKLLSALHGGL